MVALLVYAVIRTSDSSKVPDTLPIPSSSATPFDVHHILDVDEPSDEPQATDPYATTTSSSAGPLRPLR